MIRGPAVMGDLLRIHRGWLRRKAGETRAESARHGFEARCAEVEFDAQVEVERIRARRAEARRRLYRRSRLDRYRAELVAMRRAGASCADLVEWLRIKHRCRINRSSVDRYLRKLPELATTAPKEQT
ncbi:MAG: hypothetical protein ACYC9M_13430 [Desulfobulbaceae bacterium]